MGTPLPLNEPGTACPLCWGDGKPFGPGNTPQFVKLKFSDCHRTSYPRYPDCIMPNGEWLLSLTGTVCHWLYYDGRVMITYTLSPTLSRVIFNDGTDVLFFEQPASTCLTDFCSVITYSPTIYVYGGVCSVSWETEGLD